MQRTIIYLRFVIFTLAVVLVAACSDSTQTAPTATSEMLPAEVQAEDTPAPVEVATQTPASEEESNAQVLPTPKQGLAATDPTTIDLASGKPMLVEFFAFW